jgi:hypothetical protein
MLSVYYLRHSLNGSRRWTGVVLYAFCRWNCYDEFRFLRACGLVFVHTSSLHFPHHRRAALVPLVSTLGEGLAIPPGLVSGGCHVMTTDNVIWIWQI